MPVALAMLAVAALLLLGSPARADDVGAAPRANVVIGGVSVVLIAANGKLLAFVDRLADNAPAGDAELTITPIGGQPLPLERAANGMMVAPFEPGNRARDSFAIAVRSADGTGQRAVELTYRAEPAAPPPARSGLATLLGVAALSSALGAAVALLATLWYRLLRRPRAAARRVPAA